MVPKMGEGSAKSGASSARGRLRALAGSAREEARRLGSSWRPAVIVGAALLALMLPRYHRSPWPYSLLESFDAQHLDGTLERYGLSFRIALGIIVPLIVMLFMRGLRGELGLGLGKVRLGLGLCALFYLLFVPCFWLLTQDESLARYYRSVSRLTTEDFLRREVWVTFLSLFKTELLFRGFLALGLRKHVGDFAAIALSVVPYALLHLDKPELEALGSIPVGIALAYVAQKTGSIWYGLLLHWSIAVLFSFVIWIAQ